MTVRLYDRDVDLLEFEARVLSCEPAGDAWAVTLDQTAFFPEGGGQGADHGFLGEAAVLDVQDRQGVVVHRVDRPLPVGETVTGRVDGDRRFAMMQQHSGEHVLSGLICRLYGYHNVGFHIGTEAVTVDFSGPLTEEDLLRVERLANEAVWRDIPVKAWIPAPEELANLPYRSKKAIDGDLRLVEIEGCARCACCGTHVHSTGQIGMIRIVDAIHYKGGMRLFILCGGRALAYEQALQRQAREASRSLSVQPSGLSEAVRRLQAEADEQRSRANRLAMTAFELTARETAGLPVRVLRGDMLEVSQLRKAAGSLGGRLSLVLLPREQGWSFALSSAEQDVRPAAQALTAAFGGKGGGPKDMVQGVLNGGTEAEIRQLLETL